MGKINLNIETTGDSPLVDAGKLAVQVQELLPKSQVLKDIKCVTHDTLGKSDSYNWHLPNAE